MEIVIASLERRSSSFLISRRCDVLLVGAEEHLVAFLLLR